MQMRAVASTTPASATDRLFYLAKGEPSRSLYGDWQTGHFDLVVNSTARRCGEALFEADFRERGWTRTCNGRSSGCTPNRTWVAVVSQELGPIGQQTFGLPEYVLHNADRRLAHRLWNKANFGRAVERRAASVGCSADAIVPRTITDVTSCSAYRAVAAVAGSSWVVKDPSKGLGNGLLFTTWEKLGPALARACACDQRLSTSNASRTACYLAVLRGLASDGLAPPSLQKAMPYFDRQIEDLRRYAQDRDAWRQQKQRIDALLASPRRSIVVQQMVEPPLLLGGHRCSSRDYILHVRCGENCEWMWLFRGYLMIARDAASSGTAASVATNLLHPTGNAAGQPDSPATWAPWRAVFPELRERYGVPASLYRKMQASHRRALAGAALSQRADLAAGPPPHRRDRFGWTLYGSDIVFDAEGNARVLEMNTTPQLFCTRQEGEEACANLTTTPCSQPRNSAGLVGAVVDLLRCLSRATAAAVAAGAADSVRCACECARTTAPNAHGGLADGPNLIYARGCESLVPEPARNCAYS